MVDLSSLNVKLFADGANLDDIKRLAQNPLIKGFTTNPTLMRQAGIEDYEAFAQEVLAEIKDRPVSFEVFADELDQMEKQAHKIASWGENVNVKIPITNTKGVSTAPIIKNLAKDRVVVNVTAIMTVDQVKETRDALDVNTAAIVSVFAGRIADTGLDPIPVMKQCREVLSSHPKAELLWASPRETLNVFHADESGCHIITATPGILAKLENTGKDLNQFSLETVEMFYRDAVAANYSISVD